MDSLANQVIEGPHIDFIFGDQTFEVRDCDPPVKILHSISQLSTQDKFGRPK